ncbi:hypothetical protein, partial [Sphingomonas sp. PB4P5]|uniref:hypothetical protein n=1 Tax=Parasphingomonas puruogangriensis TaxID=3096155 RepID=UPI002FC94843
RQEKLLPPIATFDETPHHRPPKSDHDHSISARFHTASTNFRHSRTKKAGWLGRADQFDERTLHLQGTP